MKAITHKVYEDYPEQPYISPNRDLKEWEERPESFPYGIVERKQMERVPEGLLPGDIVMLWRINFGNITTKTIMPQYFEYRYGVESSQSIELLISLGLVRLCTAVESLDQLSGPVLKRFLKAKGVKVGGTKAELLQRLTEALTEPEIEGLFELRKYQILEAGEVILEKYDDVIQRHGPKM